MPFWIDFWSILPPNLPPKIHWNVSKIDAKMHSILDSMFGSIFGWFLLPTWIPWTQFGTSGLAPNAFFRVFWEIEIWSHFGANLAPFWDPKSIKIHEKIDSKRHPKNDRYLDRFFGQVGSILGPKLGPKSRSRRSQNASQNFFKLSKTPPKQLKSHKSIQDRNLVHFWSQNPMGYPPGPRFSRFLARLNSNFGAKFALGNLESFTSNFKIQKVNSSPNHPMSTQTSINFPSTWCPNTNFDQFSIHLRS